MTAGNGATAEPYDFRTGTELSREALAQLRGQCERLAGALGRIMNAYLDCPTDFQVLSAEAADLEVYLEELPEAVVLGVVELSTHLPGMWWQIDMPIAGAALGRMLGGPPMQIGHRPTALELAVLKRLLQEVMDVWASTWDRMARWRPVVSSMAADGTALQTAICGGEIVRVRIAAEVSGVEGQVMLCLPVGTAQRMVGEVARQAGRVIDEVRATRAAGQITVPVTVVVHQGHIGLAEVMELAEGDVLPLGKPLDDPLTVTVRGQPKFVAQAGVRAGRVAARILGPAAPQTP